MQRLYLLTSRHLLQTLSDTIKENGFVTSNTKEKRQKTNPKIVKMKDTNFSKLGAATTTWPSETEALFFNEFAPFLEHLKRECHI